MPNHTPTPFFLNQLGFKPTDLKAFTTTCAGSFVLECVHTGHVIYQGETSPLQLDESSGVHTARGVFTNLTTSGTYRIRMGEAVSQPFPINDQCYGPIKNALLKSFYYQRCGMELEPEYAGVWAHGECHTAKARVYGTEDQWLPQSGGWHDAGDYGKYTVAAAKAVADLLLAYEWFPQGWGERIHIPNSTQLPDILAEVQYELEFLFLMQRPDGGVYHKVTTAQFPPLECMPEEDQAELIFSPVSNTSAGAFAACMAMAARIYTPLESGFAEQCQRAAEKAWHWLKHSPVNQGFRNPPDIVTGEYGDECWLDEKYWAAAELYKLTGHREYLEEAETLAFEDSFPLTELGWADTGGYGTLSLLTLGEGKLPPTLSNHLHKTWKEEAELYTTRSSSDGFGISLTQDNYIWGSNMLVMNRAMLLITAATLYADDRYAQAAMQHWHYLLGQNVLGYCYVTGFGVHPVMNPHHRPSAADQVPAPVPGMVAGGPNKGLQDEAAAALTGRAPAACFIDHADSYSTNEMTIYWNSPAVFTAAFAVSYT